MKKTTLLLFTTLFFSVSLRAAHWTISNSGFTFNPSTVTVAATDTIVFSLGGSHNAQEVSQATWTAGGTTIIAGGFQTPFGGGQVLASSLSAGTHYYVCVNHAGMGMKGQIIVQSATGIEETVPSISLHIFPNPAHDILTILENGKAMEAGVSVDCYSIAGKFLGQLPLSGSTVDVKHLSAGEYLLRITEGDRKTSIPFSVAE